jgi:hypothetical protein
MPIIGDEEILARVQKFKLFRNEGNLYIDLYEAILGKPSHKFIAVPNLVIREAGAKYFGVGDSRKAALADCLKKIKNVPIHEIVPPHASEKNGEKPKRSMEPEQPPEPSPSKRKKSRFFSRRSEHEGKEDL